MTHRLIGVFLSNFGACQEIEIGRGRLETDSSLSLSDYTLLIGRNGVGKSTFLRGLRFLSELHQDSIANAIESLGGYLKVFESDMNEGDQIQLTICLQDANNLDRVLEYTIKMHQIVVQDWAQSVKEYHIVQEIREQVCDNVRLTEPKRTVVRSSSLEQEQKKIDPIDEFPDIHAYLKDKLLAFPLHSSKRGIWSYSEDDSFSIPPFDSPAAPLTSDATDLSCILARLLDKHPEIVERINEDIAELVAGWHSFESRKTRAYANRYAEEGGLMSTTVVFLYDYHKNTFSIEQLSTGTIDIIRWVTAAHLLRGGEVICIEEPENGIYLEPLHQLSAIFSQQAEEKKAQFFISTHSPDLAEEEHLENVWYMFCDTSGTANAKRCDASLELRIRNKNREKFGIMWRKGVLQDLEEATDAL